MRRVDGYLAGLWYDLFDRDIERLLAGGEPHNSDLEPLVDFVSEVAALGQVLIEDQYIADHAFVASSIIETIRQNSAADRRHSFGSRLRLKLTTGVGGIAMLGTLTGVAMASDSAVPGDWNYGIDRALERAGIGAGGIDERLQELSHMNETGRPEDALRYTPEVILSDGDSNASSALRGAAERVEHNGAGSENSTTVHQQVAELLRYLADNKGNIDRQSVAEMGKAIGKDGNGGPGAKPGNDKEKQDEGGAPASPGEGKGKPEKKDK